MSIGISLSVDQCLIIWEYRSLISHVLLMGDFVLTEVYKILFDYYRTAMSLYVIW